VLPYIEKETEAEYKKRREDLANLPVIGYVTKDKKTVVTACRPHPDWSGPTFICLKQKNMPSYCACKFTHKAKSWIKEFEVEIPCDHAEDCGEVLCESGAKPQCAEAAEEGELKGTCYCPR
jgi:hypothetical protein